MLDKTSGLQIYILILKSGYSLIIFSEISYKIII